MNENERNSSKLIKQIKTIFFMCIYLVFSDSEMNEMSKFIFVFIREINFFDTKRKPKNHSFFYFLIVKPKPKPKPKPKLTGIIVNTYFICFFLQNVIRSANE